MKIRTALAGVLMLGLSNFVMADATTAPQLPISGLMTGSATQNKQTVRNVTKLMAHLSFAAQAIDLKMMDSALVNLTQARKMCSALEKSSPEILSDYVYQYGKSTVSVENENRDYYVPVSDDLYVQSQFDEKAIWKKNPKVDEQGVSIVQSTLQLNLKDVFAAIKAAEKLVKASKFAEAGVALGGIYKTALSTQTDVTNPVWSVYGNITLAREFMNGGDFKSARYSFEAAKSDLAKIGANAVLTKNGEDAKQLLVDLDRIEKTLDEKDLSKNPATVKKIVSELTVWTGKIKGWV